jgi:hypothetical protein
MKVENYAKSPSALCLFAPIAKRSTMAMRPARCWAHRETTPAGWHLRFKIEARGEDVQVDARKLKYWKNVLIHLLPGTSLLWERAGV